MSVDHPDLQGTLRVSIFLDEYMSVSRASSALAAPWPFNSSGKPIGIEFLNGGANHVKCNEKAA